MTHHVPTTKLVFPHRRLGSYGSGPVGQMAEWITLSWTRFVCVMSSAFFVLIAQATAPFPENFVLSLASPIMAAFWIGGWKVVYWFSLVSGICPFAKVIAFGRIALYRVFSRLIVEEAPEIEMPMWR